MLTSFIHWFNFPWINSQGGMVGSFDRFIFRSQRNHCTVFHGGCTSLYSHQHWIRVPFSWHFYQHLFYFFIWRADFAERGVTEKSFVCWFTPHMAAGASAEPISLKPGARGFSLAFFLDDTHSSWGEVFLTCIFLMAGDPEHFLMCLLCIHILSFEKYLLISFLFFEDVFVFY